MSAFSCGLKYKAKKPVREIERWLEKNCKGDWHVKLARIDDSIPGSITNHLEIYFELPEDRDPFKRAHSGMQ